MVSMHPQCADDVPALRRGVCPYAGLALQVTMALSNPVVTGYATNIEVQYNGQTVKWQFEAEA